MENNIISFLCNRDNISEEIAIARIKETRDQIIYDNMSNSIFTIKEFLNLDENWYNEIMSI